MFISKILIALGVKGRNIKTKNTFADIVHNVLSSERDLVDHNKICLLINGKQSVTLWSGSIEFKNHFQQLTALFKICADLECILKGFKYNKNND